MQRFAVGKSGTLLSEPIRFRPAPAKATGACGPFGASAALQVRPHRIHFRRSNEHRGWTGGTRDLMGQRDRTFVMRNQPRRGAKGDGEKET